MAGEVSAINTGDTPVIGCESVNKLSASILLYHGTCTESLSRIYSHGLENAYFTDVFELAEYYSECAHEDLDNGEPVVLQVEVPTSLLKVDYNSYDEPLSYFRNEFTRSDSEWAEMIESGDIKYPSNEDDWQTSMAIVRSVRIIGLVAPELIIAEL